MKVAPLYHALKHEDWCNVKVVHTGQHYDAEMSDAFLQDLGLPDPDIHLGIGSGSHAEQTAGVMVAYERVCLKERPDWTVVVGDVNSTMACTLAAKKLCIPVAHLEAGLRSRDRTMPEELNRIVTDALADLLWTPSADADENLKREGVPSKRIVRVGNIMMDSYELLRHTIESYSSLADFGFDPGQCAVVTLHRPSNVDSAQMLGSIVEALIQSSRRLPLIFPVHPRTRKRLQKFNLIMKLQRTSNVYVVGSLAYIQFMSLVRRARMVITDSGGIQEETTYLDIPCLTLRDTTERPITITSGTNKLVNHETLCREVDKIMRGNWQRGAKPELWDGRTAERVVRSLKTHVSHLMAEPQASILG